MGMRIFSKCGTKRKELYFSCIYLLCSLCGISDLSVPLVDYRFAENADRIYARYDDGASVCFPEALDV